MMKNRIRVVEDAESLDYKQDEQQSLPLIERLSHRIVDEKHLWLGVDDGTLVVLDDEENDLFTALKAGSSPAAVLVEALEGESGSADRQTLERRWHRIVQLVGRLVESGFVRGIPGYHETREVCPARFARLHITRRCQLTCLHCYADSGPRIKAHGELSTGQWLDIIAEIADTGGESVLFTGGEPLLRKDCPSLMSHAKERGLRVTLFTNGLLVDKRLGDFAGAVDLVQVSLNGPDEKSNDEIRGQGTFSRVLRALDLLLAAGVPTRVGMTVMEMNWEAIRTGFLPFVRKYEKTALSYHLGYGLCRFGRGETLSDRFDLEQAKPTLDHYLAIANRDEGRRITRKTTGCGYCEQLVVAPDGRVYPCHLLKGALGHISERPLSEWYRLLVRESARHQVARVSGCRACDLRNLCGGTCRVINEQFTGDKLLTVCTHEDRWAKYRNLVRLYSEGGRNSDSSGVAAKAGASRYQSRSEIS